MAAPSPSSILGLGSASSGSPSPEGILGLNAPGAAPAAKKKKKRGGLLGTLSRLPAATANDFLNTALQTPGALANAGEYVGKDVYATLRHPLRDSTLKKQNADTAGFVKSTATALNEERKHPLRHPGDTLLTALGLLSGGAGAVERLGAATGATGAKATLKALATHPTPGVRTLNVGGMEVRGHFSRAAGSRAVQKGADALLTKAATKSSRAQDLLDRRAAKWQDRNLRVGDAVARAPGTRLAALGRKLKPEELRALRLVAEEVPVARRLGAQEMRKARAKHPKEAARHQERIDLTTKAQAFLDAAPDGKPVLKPDAKKLQGVYTALKHASTDREGILQQLDLMDGEAQQAAKTKTARLAAGGHFVSEQDARAAARDVRAAAQPAEVALEKQGKAEVRAAAQSARALDAKATSAEGKAFAAGTRRTAAEREALAAVESTSRTAARASSVRFKHGAHAEKAANAAALVQREQRLAQITYERFQRGEVGSGVLDRSQRRLARLTDDYEKHAGSLVKMREASKVGAETVAAQEKTLAALRTAERDAGSLHEIAKAEAQRARGAASGAEYNRALVKRVADTALAAKRAATARSMVEQLHRANRVVGADDITASPDAIHIGNPVEVGKLTGKARVSSGSTFGHTRNLSSLRTATGGSIEHALERNDVTNIVAERHREAVRLSSIHRRVAAVKSAGTAAPSRADDVFVWTDKTVSNERIPAEVRKFLDHPENMAKLKPQEQQSVLDQMKAAVFERHNWETDTDARANFEKLAGEGKGVFVRRRLLGAAAKRSYNAGGPGVAFVDTVNNAQKAGLIYLKLNYPIVQSLSNTAMNVIQQGFAAPVRLTQAVKLERSIGPEGAAVVDDIMGGGAVMQAAFEGQGAISTMTRNLAHVMSSKVDTPARRAAFLHEAIKAGYDTPEKWTQLISDEAHVGDLAEVAQRAKEAIVDYGEMSPFEKNVIRRLVFVYPWQKGATKYAGHFLRDHPAQAAALGMLGEQGRAQSDKTYGALPTYLQGIFGSSGRAVNPAGVNFFQTPAQIGQAIVGMATGDPAQRAAGLGFLAPAPGIVAGLLSGHDDIGRPLKSNVLGNVRDLTYGQTPLAAIGRASLGQYDPIRKALGSRTSSQTFPDPNDAYWRFLLGGLYPRKVDRGALNRNASLQKTGR